MSRIQKILLIGLALLAAFVVYLATRTRQPPVLPRDETHATFTSADACLECHGSDGAVPQNKNHPLGFDCLRCHGR